MHIYSTFFLYRSSISSREESFEHLDSGGVQDVATSDVGKQDSNFRSRSVSSRRSKSILQKAKIWETVDERPEHTYRLVGNSHLKGFKKGFARSIQVLTFSFFCG